MNKQILISWGIDEDEFELLPSISILTHEVIFKWFKLYISFFHPVKNIFDD